jgi:hypothetical protein
LRGGKTKFIAAVDADYSSAFTLENTWDTWDATGMLLELNSKKTTGSVDTSTLRSFNNGQTVFQTHNDAVAVPVLDIIQQDQDEAFINFNGTEGANQTASISTVTGDSGTVVGPQGKSSAGWAMGRMVQIEVKGATHWICTYTVAP